MNVSQRNSPPLWSEVTAIFGGRFDPPHVGHREAVRGLFKLPGVKEVLIVPSASPPHKPAYAAPSDRAEMARINFLSTFTEAFPPEIRLDLRELERAKSNPLRPSYTYDTLQEIRQQTPSLAFVMGSDQLSQLHSWYRFPEILGLAHWIVLERQTEGSKQTQQTIQDWVASGLIRSASHLTWKITNHPTYLTLVPTDAPGISSTSIRESISRAGAPLEGTILTSVLAYLKEHKLYGT